MERAALLHAPLRAAAHLPEKGRDRPPSLLLPVINAAAGVADGVVLSRKPEDTPS